MDTATLVESQIEDGQKLLDQLEQAGVSIRAACWVKPVEDDRWSLYIATPEVDEKGLTEAYRQVLQILQSSTPSRLTSSDITLVSHKHPIVRDADDMRRFFVYRTAIQSPRPLLGGIAVDEVFVYPQGKTQVTVYGMVFDGEPGSVLYLSFEPHNPSLKLVVGEGVQTKEYAAKTGLDWVIAAPEGAALERDEYGLLRLAWNLHGRPWKSTANEVLTLADLQLHGFYILHEPVRQARKAN